MAAASAVGRDRTAMGGPDRMVDALTGTVAAQLVAETVGVGRCLFCDQT